MLIIKTLYRRIGRWSFVNLKFSFCLLFFLIILTFKTSAQGEVHFAFFEDSSQNLDIQAISKKVFSEKVPFHKYGFNKYTNYWLKFDLKNPDDFDQFYMISTPTRWGKANLFLIDETDTLAFKSGSLVPLKNRAFPLALNSFKVLMHKHQTATVYLQLQGVLSIFIPKAISLNVSTLADFQQADKQRFWIQGIFVGIILVMALYNLVIFLSVRDISYFYYVLSILGIGLYFVFYYGFGIELLWQNAILWDAYAYALINPITNLSRIFFTKSYLHLAETTPLLNRLMNLLAWVSMITFGVGFACFLLKIDLLDLLVDSIGFLGTTVLSAMLLSGIIVYRKGYKPAQYFIYANLILVLGGILFIFRELGTISDNFLTRYVVQLGVIAQVVLFSLGLSSRLNQVQLQLAKLELEKERERKQLLEEQSELLKQKVIEQTTDLRELNHLKDKLLSVISHDLRNPLVSLDSFMNLLINHQDKLDRQEQITLAEKAKQSLGNLNQLLSNLLHWSRSQMNQVKFKPQTLMLLPIVENCLKLHSLDAQMKHISLEVEIPAHTKIMADEEMLEFIIRNILGNAIKFSKQGGQIKINSENSHNSLIINVLDNGVGISKEQIEAIFNKKIVSSLRGTAKEKGSGLGLAICKEFIEKHGGKLLIESPQGIGTKVSVMLPI